MKQSSPPKRNTSIDHLRGIAILIMLLTHALVPYLGKNSFIDVLWDKIHFAVPVFVFCSAFLFFDREIQQPLHFVSYLKKRLIRLLKPYYMFLAVNILILFIYRPEVVTKKYVFQSMTLTGGVDINWLVLLFIQFIPVFLLIRYLLKKNKNLFYLYGILSILSTIVLLFWLPATNYKLYMWLPWSTVIFFTYLFMHANTRRKTILTLLLWLAHMGTYMLLNYMHHTTNLFQNKYPPNLFYLSWGMTLTPILIWFSLKGLFHWKPVNWSIHYASRYSYDFFFIHYIIIEVLVIYAVQAKIPWPLFFGIVVIATYLVQMMFTKGLQAVHRTKKA